MIIFIFSFFYIYEVCLKWYVFVFFRCLKVMCIENILIRLYWSYDWRSTSIGVWSIVFWWLCRIYLCIWNILRVDRRLIIFFLNCLDRRVWWYRCVCGFVFVYIRTVRLFVRDMYYLNKSDICIIVIKFCFMVLNVFLIVVLMY